MGGVPEGKAPPNPSGFPYLRNWSSFLLPVVSAWCLAAIRSSAACTCSQRSSIEISVSRSTVRRPSVNPSSSPPSSGLSPSKLNRARTAQAYSCWTGLLTMVNISPCR